MTDFGADESFGKAVQKMKEHYGVTVPESAMSNITQKHAKNIREQAFLSESIPDKDAPVRKCYRYIKNSPTQFDYDKAIEAGLPIGSGEIESAHHYIIQKRLKIAGAWWKKDNANNMLALRT